MNKVTLEQLVLVTEIDTFRDEVLRIQQYNLIERPGDFENDLSGNQLPTTESLGGFICTWTGFL